jgi:hypothetical protein
MKLLLRMLLSDVDTYIPSKRYYNQHHHQLPTMNKKQSKSHATGCRNVTNTTLPVNNLCHSP